MSWGRGGAGGGGGWALAHPEFGVSVNPILNRGGGGQIIPTALLLAHTDLKASPSSEHYFIFVLHVYLVHSCE